jgi:hypothetical protein
MNLSAKKVNRFTQRTELGNAGWYTNYYGKNIFLFLATLPPVSEKNSRILVKITRQELSNRIHTDFHNLTRILDGLLETGLLRKEAGYDTTNINVSFPKSFLYDD